MRSQLRHVKPSVLAECLGHAGPVLVVGPFGSGKSRLLEALRAQGQHPDLVVDDLSAVEVLRRIGDEPDTPWRLGCTWLSDEQRAQLDHRVRIVGQDELWFSTESLTELIEDRLGGSITAPALAEAVMHHTYGWPILTARVVDQLAVPGERFNDLAGMIGSGPHLDGIAASFWAQVPPEQRSLVVDATRLSAITPAVADALTRSNDGMDILAETGLPLVRRQSEVWQSFPFLAGRRPRKLGAVSSVSDHAHSGDRRSTSDLAEALERSFGLVVAARELLALELPHECSRLICAGVERGSQADDPATLLALLDRIGPEASAPATLLVRARLCEVLGSFGEAHEHYGQAERVALEAGDEIVALEAALRSALLTAGTGASSSATFVLDDLASRSARAGSQTTDLLLRLVRVTVDSNSSDQTEVSRSIVVGRDLALRFLHAHLPFEAARLLRRLAVGACEHLWRFQLAADLLDQAARIEADFDLVPTRVMSVFQYAFAAETVDEADFSRWDEPATTVVRSAPYPSLVASYWIARLTFAALQGDADAAVVYANRSTEYFADFAGTHVEAFYRSRAACALAYCGRAAEAKAQLDQLAAFAALNPLETGMAEITYEARCGDPERALELAAGEVLVNVLMPYERRWQLQAECHVARCRLGIGRPEDRAEVIRLATGFGMARRASLMIKDEPKRADSQRPRLLTFGRFSIVRDDVTLDLNGNSYPLQLIKLLCIRGPVVSVDAVIDALWPDGDYEACHQRLKNLVSRARSLVGQEAIHRAPKYISLTDDVEVDFTVFHRTAIEATALSTSRERSVRAAREALDLVTGELLPGDLFASWAEEQRWQTEAVVHNLVQHALAHAQPSDCSWLLSTAQRVRVSDANVFERIQELATEHGSADTARRAAEAAVRARDEFDRDLELRP